MLKPKKLALAILIGLFLTTASLAIPQTIASQSDLREARFGLPIWFVQQDLTAINRSLPATITASSPWENPTDVRLVAFFGSWIFLTVLIFIIVEIISLLKKR